MGIFTGKKKFDKVEHLRKRYQADTTLGCEHQCDFRYTDNDSQFKNIFAIGEAKRSCVGYNKMTEDDLVSDQKGGTVRCIIVGKFTTRGIYAQPLDGVRPPFLF